MDLLVNNAGVGHYAPFAETRLVDHLEVVRLNVLATTTLIALFVPPMVARGRGRVLNVASVAAFQPTPMIAVYGAAYRLGLLWESWQPRWVVRTVGAAISRAMRPSR